MCEPSPNGQQRVFRSFREAVRSHNSANTLDNLFPFYSQLRPDPNHRKYKTSVKWKNLNPVFNEEFAFETRPNELSTQSLYITVWDKDYGKSNDYLGGLILGGIGSKGQRLKHWLDMIKYPDHRHEMWHNLTEDQIMD